MPTGGIMSDLQPLALYGGSVKLKFSPGTHRYDVSLDDGKTWEKKVGVSTILSVLAKDGLMLWPMREAIGYLKATCEFSDGTNTTFLVHDYHLEEAAKAHTKKSDSGKGTGTEIHFLIEQWLKGQKTRLVDAYSKEAIKAYDAFRKWYAKQKIEVLDVERILYSNWLDYCGTADAILNINGKKVLCDWKSTNSSRDAPKGIYPENFIQLGGYALAYEEETGEELDDLMIGNASKKGKFTAIYAGDLGLTVEKCKLAFQTCWYLHDFMKLTGKKLKEIR